VDVVFRTVGSLKSHMSGNTTVEVCKRFAAAMHQCGLTQCSRLAVAMSGGPDSTALAQLCAWWTRAGALLAFIPKCLSENRPHPL
jgi:PP-loop superfamily ATP-utilizing enzyme